MEELKFIFGSKKNPVVISLREFKGRKLFDIRKHFLNDNDELSPTKKGISLNTFQLENLIEMLNTKQREITTFFNKEEKMIANVDIDITNTFGRRFDIQYDNEVKRIVLDESLANSLKENNMDLFEIFLLSLYDSLYDIVEDDDDINLILDIFDKKLKKSL